MQMSYQPQSLVFSSCQTFVFDRIPLLVWQHHVSVAHQVTLGHLSALGSKGTVLAQGKAMQRRVGNSGDTQKPSDNNTE